MLAAQFIAKKPVKVVTAAVAVLVSTGAENLASFSDSAEAQAQSYAGQVYGLKLNLILRPVARPTVEAAAASSKWLKIKENSTWLVENLNQDQNRAAAKVYKTDIYIYNSIENRNNHVRIPVFTSDTTRPGNQFYMTFYKNSIVNRADGYLDDGSEVDRRLEDYTRIDLTTKLFRNPLSRRFDQINLTDMLNKAFSEFDDTFALVELATAGYTERVNTARAILDKMERDEEDNLDRRQEIQLQNDPKRRELLSLQNLYISDEAATRAAAKAEAADLFC